MRNLKKILALVLALVMVIGLMGVASAAKPGTSYKDDASITNYDEAIQVLTALGIYEGDENAAFNPNNTITRAEVATLVYRIVTQDVDGEHVALYADYNKFADVDSNAWYAGYVNFCANGGYLMGDGTNFYPMEKVTGYQVLAIMLRVLGYGQEGEYEGTNWHIRTASKADELGITATVVPGTLGAYSTRGMVAELLYRAIAQTSTVLYNRIDLYTKTNATYAFLHFGLVGQTGYWYNDHADYRPDANGIYNLDGYKWMTIRSKAEADTKYGEPVAYWYTVKLDNAPSYKEVWAVTDTIEIRFNTVATYSDYVNEKTLYAINKVAYNYAIDGDDYVEVSMDNSGYTIADGTGRGVTTEVFNVDGRMFVVVKNNWVAKVQYNWNATYKNIVLTCDNSYPYGVSGTVADPTGVSKNIKKNYIVLFNTYEQADGTYIIDVASIRHCDTAQQQTIAWSYIPSNYYYGQDLQDKSTFTVGSTTYVYSHNYAKTMKDALLDREALVEDGKTVQNLYFDDYGNVIYTQDYSAYTSYETGYVIVRYGTYGGRIADNRWVGEFTVIHEDGSVGTIKGALNSVGYYEKQYSSSDWMAADLGMYSYTKVGDYYALTAVAPADNDAYSDEIGLTSIEAGDAVALPGTLSDDNTVYIIAEYDATGAITGYKTVKGFKNLPDLSAKKNSVMTVEYTWYYGVSTFVFIRDAIQTPNAVISPVGDSCFYLVDTNPSKQFNEFDRHTVVVGGKKTTMDFVKGFVNADHDATTEGVQGLVEGFYYVAGTTNGLVSAVVPGGNWLFGDSYVDGEDTIYVPITLPTSGVLYVPVATMGGYDVYYAMADNCVVYNIDSATGAVEVIAPADYADTYAFFGFAAAYNSYGYVTALYLVDAVVG